MGSREIANFQIGKNGLTDGVVESLRLAFKKHKTVRISLLKSAAEERSKIKEIAEEIVKDLDGKGKYRIIGFTIVMRRTARLTQSL